MAKNQKNPKKKKKASVVIFVIELIALLVLVAGIFVYARINDGLRNLGTSSALNQTTGTGTVAGQISQADGTVIAETADNQAAAPADVTADPNFDGDAAEENAEIAQNSSLKGYTNIALVGIDTRDNSGIDYANSDTMIIASINNDTGQIRMVSIYRDTLLNIGKNLTYNVKQGDYDEDDAAFDIVEDYGDDNGGDYDDGGDDYDFSEE
ncbi:MAG: hypothetical protein Q4B09_03885 [Lachnospiraceae bacterium]|nr:hypothetical protein [Lachnospiraceae bacterium]